MANDEAIPAACPYDDFCLGMCEWTDCPAAAPLTSQPHPAASEPLPSTSGTGTRAFNYPFSPPKLPIPPDSSITAQSDLNLVPSLSNQHAPKTELQAQDVDETRPPSKRGRFQFSSENSLVQLAKGLIPENTSKSTFEQWKETIFQKLTWLHYQHKHFQHFS